MDRLKTSRLPQASDEHNPRYIGRSPMRLEGGKPASAGSVRVKVLARPRFTTWLRRIFAGSFAALGARLVLTER